MNWLTTRVKELFKGSPSNKLLSKEEKLSAKAHSIADDRNAQENSNLAERSKATDCLQDSFDVAGYHVQYDKDEKDSLITVTLRDALTDMI